MTRTPISIGRRHLLQGFLALLGIAAAGGARAEGGGRQRIRLATNSHFPPFSFAGKQGPLRGLLVDELRLMADAAGVILDFTDRPWARGQQMVRAGELDAFCTIPTDERRGYVLFAPTPLFQEDIVLIGRADDPRTAQARTLDDLKGLKIAEPLGTGWTRGHLPDEQIVWSSDVENILSMVVAGRVDATIFGRSAVEAVLAGFPHAERLRLTVFPALPRDEGFCFGLRKGFPDAESLIVRIDGVLRGLTAAGAFEPIRARYLSRG